MTFTVCEVRLRLSASLYVSDLHIGMKDQNIEFPKLTDIFKESIKQNVMTVIY
jgi:hypothetical protein